MRWLLTLGLAAGCYNPAVSPGAPCESACPGELVCVEHVCREPGYLPVPDAGPIDAPPVDAIDAPPGDSDADGVTDDIDNCPADANADQHDEDGDAIGDVCDPCPHLAGTAADGDGDGVGDACDPQPTVAKQRIAFFDPFTSGRAEWTDQSNVTRVGETLRLNSAGYAGALLSVPNAETRIVMAGTIAAIVPTSSSHQIAFEIGRNVAGDVYHYTEFYDEGGSAGDIAVSRANKGVYSTLANTQYTGVLPTGAWSMAIDSSVAGQQIALSTILGGTARMPLSAATSALAASTTMQLDVHGADVRLDYLIVIETMP